MILNIILQTKNQLQAPQKPLSIGTWGEIPNTQTEFGVWNQPPLQVDGVVYRGNKFYVVRYAINLSLSLRNNGFLLQMNKSTLY